MDEAETFLSFLEVFDAVVTEAMKEFRPILQKLKEGEQYVG